MLFRLVVRNGFAHFVRKVFARRKLLTGKFCFFAPLNRDKSEVEFFSFSRTCNNERAKSQYPKVFKAFGGILVSPRTKKNISIYQTPTVPVKHPELAFYGVCRCVSMSVCSLCGPLFVRDCLEDMSGANKSHVWNCDFFWFRKAKNSN